MQYLISQIKGGNGYNVDAAILNFNIEKIARKSAAAQPNLLESIYIKGKA